MDRVERDVLRRNDAEQKAFSAKDFACTFQPQLSKIVEKMKPRSVYEMSRGDLLRRETSAKMMKLRIEREEMEQLTYQPEISRLGKKVQSSLKLREDPAFFLQHYKGLESGKARRREMERQQRAQQEMEHCTFRYAAPTRTVLIATLHLCRHRAHTSPPWPCSLVIVVSSPQTRDCPAYVKRIARSMQVGGWVNKARTTEGPAQGQHVWQ